MVPFAAGRFTSGQMTGLPSVRSRRTRSGVETEDTAGAVELLVLVISIGRVVCEEISQVTHAKVPDGGRTGDFRLSTVLNSEYRLLFRSQKVLTSRSREQSIIQ